MIEKAKRLPTMNNLSINILYLRLFLDIIYREAGINQFKIKQ